MRALDRNAVVYRYCLPMEAGVVLRNQRLKTRDGLLVRLQQGERQGWGEIAPLPEFSQETLAQATQAALAWLKSWQVGKAPADSPLPSVAFGLSCALAECEQRLPLQADYRKAPLCSGDPDKLFQVLSASPGEKLAKLKVGLYEVVRDGMIVNLLLEALPALPASMISLALSSSKRRWFNPVLWVPQRLATLTLTSGSSGAPKAAAHSYAGHLASASGVRQLLRFQRQDRWLLSLPLFHVSGQGIVWRWLAVGATLVLRDKSPLVEALVGCTHASLVPTQLWRLLAQPLEGMTLKGVLLGGAMIPEVLTEKAAALGIHCWCGYGLTELASTVCAKRADTRPGVGLPLDGCEIKLVNQEIWVRA
ncbi:o-succinylbenzoate synthase [Serratia symbiotica]|uniref:o-succinylbenzoate synthase n=1 Tax=Serratia symbiotica TaxID=138074 RepID=UPI0013607712|nr:o-succinylbenzoate synthase [Serratia symbiotica]